MMEQQQVRATRPRSGCDLSVSLSRLKSHGGMKAMATRAADMPPRAIELKIFVDVVWEQHWRESDRTPAESFTKIVNIWGMEERTPVAATE